MKCQILFSGKNKKIISKCRPQNHVPACQALRPYQNKYDYYGWELRFPNSKNIYDQYLCVWRGGGGVRVHVRVCVCVCVLIHFIIYP